MGNEELRNYGREEFKNWVDKALIRIGYWPNYGKDQREWIDKIKPAEIINQLVEGKIQVIEWSVPETYVCLNAGVGGLHPGFGDSDYDTVLEEIIREARKKGIKVIAGVSVYGGRYWSERNPEALKRQGGKGFPCINGPFRKGYLELVSEVARQYDVDGIVMDGPRMHISFPRRENGEIICEYCEKKYKEQTGSELPLEEDWNDPNWKRYIRWHEQTISEFAYEIKQAIKLVDPRIYVVMHDHIGLLYGWTSPGDIDFAHRVTDATSHECLSLKNSCIYTMEILKLARSALDGRAPVCYHLGFNMDSSNCGAFAYGKPTREEVDLHAHLSLSQASPVCYHSSMDDEGKPHPERTKIYQEVSRDISKEMEWLVESKPVYDIGIHYSQNARDYYGGANSSTYTDSYLGMAQALTESHICTGTLLDSQFDEKHLKRYKTIILPNSACLSDNQVEAIRAYVKEGGGLFATAETSLYDENENKRDDFGLADVLGIEFNGIGWRADKFLEDYRLKRHPFYLHPHQITTGIDELNITNLPWFGIKVKDNLEVIASWAEIKEESRGSRSQNGGEWQITGDSRRPCLIAGKYGKGRVVYTPTNLSARWYLERTANIRKLIANIVNWLSPPAIKVKAPKSVVAGITFQGKQKRTILHLVNYSVADLPFRSRSAETLKRKFGRKDVPDKEMEKFMYLWRRGPDNFHRDFQIDEVIPVYNVEIAFDSEVYKPKRVYLAPERKELSIKDMPGGFSKVTVPMIDLHSLVVFE